MRIQNKYLRNKAHRAKHWQRIRTQSHPYETFCPYEIHWAPHSYWERRWDTEEQIKNHFEWIDQQARAIENGTHKRLFHAPKHFRQDIWRSRKAQDRAALNRVRNGDHDSNFPNWKKDADWDWF
jgi:hypothetical protein